MTSAPGLGPRSRRCVYFFYVHAHMTDTTFTGTPSSETEGVALLACKPSTDISGLVMNSHRTLSPKSPLNAFVDLSHQPCGHSHVVLTSFLSQLGTFGLSKLNKQVFPCVCKRHDMEAYLQSLHPPPESSGARGHHVGWSQTHTLVQRHIDGPVRWGMLMWHVISLLMRLNNALEPLNLLSHSGYLLILGLAAVL